MRSLLALVAAIPGLALATVNVNSAQQSELLRVKGMDRVKAKAIIEWRAANGPIDNFNELGHVPGFTAEVVDRLKPQLGFDGDPYVGPKKEPKKKKPAAAARVAGR